MAKNKFLKQFHFSLRLPSSVHDIHRLSLPVHSFLLNSPSFPWRSGFILLHLYTLLAFSLNIYSSLPPSLCLCSSSLSIAVKLFWHEISTGRKSAARDSGMSCSRPSHALPALLHQPSPIWWAFTAAQCEVTCRFLSQIYVWPCH